MLTAEQIVEEKLVTRIDSVNLIQQVGIDCEIIKVNNIVGVGIVPRLAKTILPAYEEIAPTESPLIKSLLQQEIKGWLLQPGYYEIVLRQGCSLPDNRTLLLTQRSSLCRSGAIIHSGVYDPGFKTDNIGAFLQVLRPIFIEYQARVCQATVHVSDKVKDTYKGQFQEDIQRRS